MVRHKIWVKFHWPNLSCQVHTLTISTGGHVHVVIATKILQVDGFLDGKIDLVVLFVLHLDHLH